MERRGGSSALEFKANATLVLKTQRDHSQTEEPSGEAVSLRGRLIGRMGDRAGRDTTKHIAEKTKGADTYQPRTRETAEAWESLLGTVRGLLGDVPSDVVQEAAEETLGILRNRASEAEKRQQLENLLGSSVKSSFSSLAGLGRALHDYGASDGGQAVSQGDQGMAVVYDEEEEEAEQGRRGLREGYDREIGSEDEGDDVLQGGEGGEEAEGELLRVTGNYAADAAAEGDEEDIDAYWVQRRVAPYAETEVEAPSLAEEVLKVLEYRESSDREREMESSLLDMLGFDALDVVRELVRRADEIWILTKYRRSINDDEKSELLRLLEERAPKAAARLHRKADASTLTSATEGHLQRRVAQEARALRQATQSNATIDDSEEATGVTATLRLENMVWKDGARTMTNTEVEVEGATRVPRNGWEEIVVPARKPSPLGAGERLIPIAELPEWTHAAFKGMESLNRVQSRLCEFALGSPDNLLLCAPTGAGKTNVAVLTVLQQIGLHLRNADKMDISRSEFKVVYVAPMKALVQEVVANLNQRFGPDTPYNLSVRELSGDSTLSRQQLEETSIIVTTPEKWDVVSRKAGERAFARKVRLVILDEVHLLHDERGAVLEAIVARILRQVEATGDPTRLVGLSATLPNYEDAAAFLRVDPARGLFFFDNSFRPCPLQLTYVGVTEKHPLKRMELMNEICFEKIRAGAGRHQCIVFVHSRKETARTASALRDLAVESEALSDLLPEDSGSRAILAEEVASVKDDALRDLLPFGFGIHHAGMRRDDRTLVEDLFADGHLQVLVSTATLAWGVNLPAHTVIIKGTQVYAPDKGGWTELSPLDVMQMLGRAGRPQFDTHGEGFILTRHSELLYYLSLLHTQLPIESQLVRSLPDHLNAEIAAGAVLSRADAARWLSYTFLYVRTLRSPELYHVDPEEAKRSRTLRQHRLNVAHAALVELERCGLVRYEHRSGALQPTALGRVASNYYVTSRSVATYQEHLSATSGDIDLLRTFALSDEFRQLVVRSEEKEELRKVMERVPIPVREAPDDPAAKVNVLLQAFISRLRLDGLALTADMVYVQQSAGRLVRALFEMALRRGWARVALRALRLAQSVDQRMWAAQTPLRQFVPGLPEQILRSIERKDVPWEHFADLRPADLGELVRDHRLGRSLHRLVASFPRVELSARVQPLTRALVKVDLSIVPDFRWDRRYHGDGLALWVIVEDADGERILHHDQLVLRARHAEAAARAAVDAAEDGVEVEVPASATLTASFVLPLGDPVAPHYFVRVVFDRWLRAEAELALSFRSLLLPERFHPPTELLDLRPLPLDAALRGFRSTVYVPRGASDPLNPVLTQATPAVRDSDENVLVAAPPGSGTSFLADVALLRLWERDGDATAVWLCPLPPQIPLVVSDLEERFPDKTTVELTGEPAADLALLERAHVAVATVEQWDRVGRRWKQRRAVREVGLFVLQDLHLAGGGAEAAAVAAGCLGASALAPTYEAVVSRARFVATQVAAQAMESGAADSDWVAPRILGLAACAANAHDLAEWLGCDAEHTLAFKPDARPLPIDVRFRSFDVSAAKPRLAAMRGHVYRALVDALPHGPAIVFVPTRREAAILAADLVASAHAENQPNRFLQQSSAKPSSGGDASSKKSSSSAAAAAEESTPTTTLTAEEVQILESEPAVLACLQSGVAVYHHGLDLQARSVMESHFGTLATVAVVPVELAWGVPFAVRTVVIHDTQHHDARTRSYGDYSPAELAQMLGHAGRAGVDASGQCLVLCASTRRESVKRFLLAPAPVESRLDQHLHETVNAEVVSRVIATRQDAVDFLVWTLYFRRLARNPNFYGVLGVSHAHLSDHISELVERTLTDLAEARCLSLQDADVAPDEDEDAAAGGGAVDPLNLGRIASFYACRHATVDVFAASVRERTKLRGLLAILAAAAEYDDVAVRRGDEAALRGLAHTLRFPVPSGYGDPESDALRDPHVKTHLLLQAHMSRRPLPPSLRADAAVAVGAAPRLLAALVDVASSHGWLRPALAAMEFSQMVIQALWAQTDSPLLQVPHFTPELAEKCAAHDISTVIDLIEMDDAPRRQLLDMDDVRLSDVARFCGRYPALELTWAVVKPDGEVFTQPDEEEDEEEEEDDNQENESKSTFTKQRATAPAGGTVTVHVELERDEETEGMDEGAGRGAVHAPLFPSPKTEGWWVLVGDPATNALVAIKRSTFAQKARLKLPCELPDQVGPYDLKLYLMSDSYVGCDQEYTLHFNLE